MTDVLIRNVDDDDLARIDAIAAELGLSRNELLRRETREITRRHALSHLSMDDLRQATGLARGALDEELMRGAWR